MAVVVRGARGGPFLDEGFVYSSGLEPARRQGLLDAVYVSTVALATLGFGDIVPSEGWLRLAATGQALVGFSLLTAAVSWLIQLESTISRRRALARHLSQVRRAAEREVPSDGGGSAREGAEQVVAAGALDHAATELARVHVDLSHATITYYFTDQEEAVLAAGLPWLVRAAQAAAHDRDPRTCAAAQAVLVAVDDLLTLVDTRFLHGDGSREESLRLLAAQHGYPGAV